MNRNRNSSGRRFQSRGAARAQTGVTGAMTGGIRMTGIGEIGAIAEAMNELPTQISS